MNPGVYGAFMILIVLFVLHQQRKNVRRVCRVRRKKRGRIAMNELIQRFVGKQCYVYSENGNAVLGVVETVEGNWVSVQTKQGTELVNLDYISRIKEKPAKK